MPAKRIILNILILIAIMQGWWFVALPLGLVGTWYLNFYLEIVLAGVIYDLLFGINPQLGIAGYIGTIVAITSFALLELLKRVVRD